VITAEPRSYRELLLELSHLRKCTILTHCELLPQNQSSKTKRGCGKLPMQVDLIESHFVRSNYSTLLLDPTPNFQHRQARVRTLRIMTPTFDGWRRYRELEV
jgi:hypothetical protein